MFLKLNLMQNLFGIVFHNDGRLRRNRDLHWGSCFSGKYAGYQCDARGALIRAGAKWLGFRSCPVIADVIQLKFQWLHEGGMVNYRIVWTTRHLLVLITVLALALALIHRRSRFRAAIEGHQAASLACQKSAFNAMKWGDSPSTVIAISAVGKRHRQAASLHSAAIWRPWILISPRPIRDDSILVVDEVGNTTTRVLIRR